MLWAAARILHSIVADVNRWSAPHAEVERPEPISHRPRTGRHADYGHRDEPVELARCRYRAWRRAPAVEKARGRRERIAEAAASMASGSGEGRTQDRAHCSRLPGRDGFWLARWLKARGIEAYVIHASSVAVSREHRRAKTDRLDTELLKRSFLGWLRGERDHCKMVEIPTMKD